MTIGLSTNQFLAVLDGLQILLLALLGLILLLQIRLNGFVLCIEVTQILKKRRGKGEGSDPAGPSAAGFILSHMHHGLSHHDGQKPNSSEAETNKSSRREHMVSVSHRAGKSLPHQLRSWYLQSFLLQPQARAGAKAVEGGTESKATPPLLSTGIPHKYLQLWPNPSFLGQS